MLFTSILVFIKMFYPKIKQCNLSYDLSSLNPQILVALPNKFVVQLYSVQFVTIPKLSFQWHKLDMNMHEILVISYKCMMCHFSH